MTKVIMWFRQDLRLADNPAFFAACEHQQIIPLYIFDKTQSILGEAQAWWLHHSLLALEKTLHKQGLKLILRKGKPLEIISALIKEYPIDAVYWNRCYDAPSMERDSKIKEVLTQQEIDVESFNGGLLHEPWAIKNQAGDFFKVFTPYWNKCKQSLIPPEPKQVTTKPSMLHISSEKLADWQLLPKLDWASRFSEFWHPGEEGALKKLDEFIHNNLTGYKKNRDIPAQDATSRLSPHLHFGEISPWTVVRAIELAKLEPQCDLASAERFITELGWREFSTYMLYHVPKLPSDNFKADFNHFAWENDKKLFACWKKGTTGYPIVDAGMRELWVNGYMHNRVRMIVASFLTKDLLIDWRWGADWFLDTLVDADLANNSANWQWVAGCGADAAPYFRIFNPVLQSQKFDADGTYIRTWVPELASLSNAAIHAPWEQSDADALYAKTKYPRPIIDHKMARDRALGIYRNLKKQPKSKS